MSPIPKSPSLIFMNIASNLPPSPTADTMPPTEKAFLHQAGTIHDALETFLTISKKGSPHVVYCSLLKLVGLTVRFIVFWQVFLD